jgi:hypothetical protein
VAVQFVTFLCIVATDSTEMSQEFAGRYDIAFVRERGNISLDGSIKVKTSLVVKKRHTCGSQRLGSASNAELRPWTYCNTLLYVGKPIRRRRFRNLFRTISSDSKLMLIIAPGGATGSKMLLRFICFAPLVSVFDEWFNFCLFNDRRFLLSCRKLPCPLAVLENSAGNFAVYIGNRETKILFLRLLLAAIRVRSLHVFLRIPCERSKRPKHPDGMSTKIGVCMVRVTDC